MKHRFSILALALFILLAAASVVGCGGEQPTEQVTPNTGSQATEQPRTTGGSGQATARPTSTTGGQSTEQPTPTSGGDPTGQPAPTTSGASQPTEQPTPTAAPATDRATTTPAPTPAPTATPTPPPTPEPPAVAWEGAAALLPSGLGEVEVWDWEAALSSGAVDYGHLANYSWGYVGWLAEDPENSGVSIDDFRSIAFALVETEQGPYMNLGVLEGDFDLAKAQEYLDNLFTQYFGYDDPADFRESYKGYEIYEDQHNALALLDDKDAIAFGDPPEAVRVLVDAVASGSSLLLHGNEYRIAKYADYPSVDAEEFMGMTLNRLGGGFYANVGGGSRSSSFDGCCWASGYSVSGSGGELGVTIVYPFREEGRAERQVGDVRIHIEGNLPDEAALGDVEADGIFVVGTATVAADVWRDAFSYYWGP